MEKKISTLDQLRSVLATELMGWTRTYNTCGGTIVWVNGYFNDDPHVWIEGRYFDGWLCEGQPKYDIRAWNPDKSRDDAVSLWKKLTREQQKIASHRIPSDDDSYPVRYDDEFKYGVFCGIRLGIEAKPLAICIAICIALGYEVMLNG